MKNLSNFDLTGNSFTLGNTFRFAPDLVASIGVKSFFDRLREADPIVFGVLNYQYTPRISLFAQAQSNFVYVLQANTRLSDKVALNFRVMDRATDKSASLFDKIFVGLQVTF